MEQRDIERVEQPVQLRRELTRARYELADRMAFSVKVSLVISAVITYFAGLVGISSPSGSALATVILLAILFVGVTATLTLLGSGIMVMFAFFTSTPEIIQAARHDRAIRHEQARLKSESNLGGALAISEQDEDERGRLSMNSRFEEHDES